MRACARCGGLVERNFRFCPWCAAPQRLKLVEFFPPHPLIERDQGKALRVSRYVGDSLEGSHVRFSVWDETDVEAKATAAVSLDDGEANRLARFLAATGRPGAARPRLRSLIRW
jgi:hypothetical protein